MSYSATVFRILIASPSDVEEERDIAVETIQSWNDLNSADRQVVLLPLRWETHAAPEFGRRPQEVINRQVVDHSDLLIGIFWTRVGSPTGASDSGTLEEIDRVASRGKPVMLYFSQAKQDPDRIDTEQLTKLREFKAKTYPRALVESYISANDFRGKLSRQVEIQLRTLLSEEGANEKSYSTAPTTEIQFGFADPQTGLFIGSDLKLQSSYLNIQGTENIPDYERSGSAGSDTYTVMIPNNKDYYRQYIDYIRDQNFFRPIRFWLKNTGVLGARDVYVDIRFSLEDTDITVVSLGDVQLSAPTKSGFGLLGSFGRSEGANKPEQVGKQWSTHFELRALQPQREVSPPPP